VPNRSTGYACYRSRAQFVTRFALDSNLLHSKPRYAGFPLREVGECGLFPFNRSLLWLLIEHDGASSDRTDSNRDKTDQGIGQLVGVFALHLPRDDD